MEGCFQIHYGTGKTEKNGTGNCWFSGMECYWRTMGGAEVYINGKNAGIIWKQPYQTDISSYLKVGKNTLEIKVVNSWVNRLVGDMQPGAKKIGFITIPLFKADTPLEPAGLLGPVQLLRMKKEIN